MTEMVYDIPANLIPAYRGQMMIVRSESAAELVAALSENDVDKLIGVQLLSLTSEIDALADWGEAVPVELVMLDPEKEFPLLYRHAKLLDKHPVRVSIPVVSGFSKAVKVATSLQFFIKLELGQPDDAVIPELRDVLNFYLHQPMVRQPIEPFQGTLMGFYFGHETSLWAIQEEDPAYVRYVLPDGAETIIRSLGGRVGDHSSDERVTHNLASFVADHARESMVWRKECGGCEFFEHCGGYFKWPQPDFACDGVKSMFRTLAVAAEDLHQDIAALSGAGRGA